MRNKNSLFKLCTMAIAISGFGISFSSATLFHLEVNTGGLSAAEIAVMKDDIKNKLMPVHFADNGNDFGGFFYFSNGLTGTNSTSKNKVTIQHDTGFDCDNQVRGYYYNAERGERLRPLDEDTKDTRKDLNDSQGELALNGGIYTVCTVSGYNQALTDCGTQDTTTGYEACIDNVRQQYKADDNGYYGYIEHEYSGQTMALVAGVDYDNFNRPNDFVTISGTSKFSPTFIRYLNQNPVGFIYDYNGGVGLVGCKFKRPPSDSVKKVMQNLYNPGPANLKNIFFVTGDNKIEVLSPYGTYIDCSGSNAVWSPVLSLIIEGIIGLADEQKVGYIGTQKDDKMQYFSSASINNNTLINYAKKKAEILCRGRWNCNTSDSIVCCDRSITPTDKSKIYVVKNGNVTISPETNCDFNTNGYYNVVIVNGGNLIINESVGSSKCVFGGDGFLMGSSNTPEAFASAVSGDALNGQYNDYDLRAGAAVGSYIKGNFIVDGYITGNNSDLKNKYFIYGKLTTQDDYKTLLSTFSWRCNYGLSTEEADGTKNFCPNSLYQGAPLTVIDQNYPSPFYNS